MMIPVNEIKQREDISIMSFIRKNGAGILLCLAIAIPSWIIGQRFPVVGGAVIGILAGMAVTVFWKNKGPAEGGIRWTSKYILQTAVVLLGFGMDLGVIAETGKQSLPIIICTISTSLIIAWLLHQLMHVPGNISTLVGVGSSICGGSAIAATAPVIGADDDEVAQAISVIFFFNVLAAVFFPILGRAIGFDTTSGDAFGIFAGTAVNDTSSVTAAASTWDSMWGLGNQTLDKAVTVKLTRTLAIIPISLDQIRKSYKFDVSCQGSVPVALEAFFEAVDFEDAIRNAISVGGDSDTIAAMAGAVAEAYFGVPEGIIDSAINYLDARQMEILYYFEKRYPSKALDEDREATRTVFEVLDDSVDKVIPAGAVVEVDGEYPGGAVHAWVDHEAMQPDLL